MKEETVKRELKCLIDQNIITMKETKRIWSQKVDINDYERGRADGIILYGMDLQDNLLRFAERIGIKWDKGKGEAGT